MIVLVIAIVMMTGYNFYSSHKDVKLSNLAMINMEALAQNESSGGNCEPSTSRECCVCNGIHYTYQSPVNRYCESADKCAHWEENN